MKKIKTRNASLFFILMILLWLALAGDITVEQLIIGSIVSILIIIYSYDLLFERESMSALTPKRIGLLIVLLFVLLREMVVANFQIAKIVLSRKMPIEDGFIRFKQPLKKEVNQAFYGNFITLTPGTLTVFLNKDEILVHGLTKHNRNAIVNGPLERAFKKFEGEAND